MSKHHKRPLLAFISVAILCIVLLGSAVRSEAFGLLISANREPLGTEQARLSAVVRDRVVVDAKRVRSPRVPALASTTPVAAPKAPAPTRGAPAVLTGVNLPGAASTPARPHPGRAHHGKAQPARAHPGRALGHLKHGPWPRASAQGRAHGKGHGRGLSPAGPGRPRR